MSNEKQNSGCCKNCNGQEEKQIEEMALIIGGSEIYDHEDYLEARQKAKALYNANFRKQEWISVEDRLPEENGRYLVCIKVSHQLFENLTTIAVLDYNKSHGFYLYSIAESVTHWMPLPEAPKMKGGAE